MSGALQCVWVFTRYEDQAVEAAGSSPFDLIEGLKHHLSPVHAGRRPILLPPMRKTGGARP